MCQFFFCAIHYKIVSWFFARSSARLRSTGLRSNGKPGSPGKYVYGLKNIVMGILFFFLIFRFKFWLENFRIGKVLLNSGPEPLIVKALLLFYINTSYNVTKCLLSIRPTKINLLDSEPAHVVFEGAAFVLFILFLPRQVNLLHPLSNVLPTMLKMRQRETGEGCQEKGCHGGWL